MSRENIDSPPSKLYSNMHTCMHNMLVFVWSSTVYYVNSDVLASVPRFDSTTYCGRVSFTLTTTVSKPMYIHTWTVLCVLVKVDVYDAREVGGNISQLLSVTAEGQQV